MNKNTPLNRSYICPIGADGTQIEGMRGCLPGHSRPTLSPRHAQPIWWCNDDADISIPISNYGAIMFVTETDAHNGDYIWLYRHSPSIVGSTPPAAQTSLEVR